MENLNLDELLAGGVSGVVLFAAWLYLVLRWFFGWDWLD